MRDFRFSFNVRGVETAAALAAQCRRAEGYGYDTVFAADHLGSPAPFPLLVAAAGATLRLRMGTLVLNAAFWNPALLAREVATTDVLTDGRLEIGLGAGHMKWEFDEAGIGWAPFAARADALRSMIGELRRCLHAEYAGLPEGVTPPRPVQRHGYGVAGPPLIVGGTGDRILRIGAEHADIVSVAGVYQIPGAPPGTFRLGTAAQAADRIRFARDCAGRRADEIEWHLLVQAVVVTEDRRGAAQKLVDRFGAALEMTVDEVLETPFLLIGTAEQMAGQLLEQRERYGYSYLTVHEPFMETFAPVIEVLRR